MKVINLALLGTAALVAASIGARAENLDALKTQMDTLTLDAVADAPAAATTTVTFDGYIRAAIVTGRRVDTVGNPALVPGGLVGNFAGAVSGPSDNYATDVRARAGVSVHGKTDTAVGEVGVNINLLAPANDVRGIYNSGNGAVTTDGFNGYWKFTPNLTLSAGILGALSKSSYSFDATCTCAYNDPFGAIIGSPQGDPTAFRIAYADGPLTFAAQLEDTNNVGNSSAVGGTAKIGYAMDIFGFDLNGGYWGNAGGNAAYSVSGGIGINFAPISLGVAVGTGNNGSFVSSNLAANQNFTVASGYAKAALGDSASLEFGVFHDFSALSITTQDKTAGLTSFDAGLYYSPVKQLKFGLEGNYQSGGAYDGSYTAAFVSWFKF